VRVESFDERMSWRGKRRRIGEEKRPTAVPAFAEPSCFLHRAQALWVKDWFAGGVKGAREAIEGDRSALRARLRPWQVEFSVEVMEIKVF